MPRDDFSQPTIERLRSRVSNHCSNPDCDKATIGPAGEDGVNRIGVAAHIHAASPGGPRFLAAMTPKARKSFENGIWLCNNCSRDVDNDAERFPAELLKEWKRKAEHKARERIGKPSISERTVRDQMQMLFGSAPTSFQISAIDNVHSAAAAHLEKMDPRFEVITKYDGQGTYVELRAKQTVPMQLKVSPQAVSEFQRKFMQCFEHGQSVSFDGSMLNIEGSPLFDQFMQSLDQAELQIVPEGMPSILKLSTHGDTKIAPIFEDFHGAVVVGSKSFTFSGQAFAGVLRLELRHFHSMADGAADFFITFDDSVWDERDIRRLPFFESIIRLYEVMSRQRDIVLQLFVRGFDVLTATINVKDSDQHMKWTLNSLCYLQAARAVAQRQNVLVHYQARYPFSAKQHIDLQQAAAICEGKYSVEGGIAATCTMIVTDETMCAELEDSSRPHSVRMSQDIGLDIDVYGQVITLPPMDVVLDCVFAEILSEQIDEEGHRLLEIAWRPLEGFSCTYLFKTSDTPSLPDIPILNFSPRS